MEPPINFLRAAIVGIYVITSYRDIMLANAQQDMEVNLAKMQLNKKIALTKSNEDKSVVLKKQNDELGYMYVPTQVILSF